MCFSLGKTVDKALGSIAQPYAPKALKNYVPSLGESIDPHYFRTNAKAEERHQELGLRPPEIPDPPPPPASPQSAKSPNTLPLKRRNANGGPALPGGGTVLTGPSGVPYSAMNLGTSTALGG